MADELRQALEEEQFGSLEEARTFLDRRVLKKNRTPLDEFHGLSPEQMYRVLNLPFASPDIVCFPEVLGSTPDAPVLDLFHMLTEAIGEQGLKPTAKGNLPQKFCREAARAYWDKEAYAERTRFGGINKEDDFPDLHVTRVVVELTGFIRKYRGRFILSSKCRKLLAGDGLAAVYPALFRAYTGQFNWAYRDGYVELRFIQGAFLFTLYLLEQYGDAWRPNAFYEDCFLRAFPAIVDEVPSRPAVAAEEQVRACYTWRTLVHFAGFLGLAAVEPVTDSFLCHECRVKALPLLHEAVAFTPSTTSTSRRSRRHH